MQGFDVFGPGGVGLARDFPFLTGLAERRVQFGAQGLQRLLPFLPDHIDLGIVGDRFEHNVWDALIDEALTNVAARRRRSRHGVRYLGLLGLSFRRVGKVVIGVLGAHYARAGERKRHARGINRDPAPTPLLGNGGGCSSAASRVQHQIAWVGCHEDATLH